MDRTGQVSQSTPTRPLCCEPMLASIVGRIGHVCNNIKYSPSLCIPCLCAARFSGRSGTRQLWGPLKVVDCAAAQARHGEGTAALGRISLLAGVFVHACLRLCAPVYTRMCWHVKLCACVLVLEKGQLPWSWSIALRQVHIDGMPCFRMLWRQGASSNYQGEDLSKGVWKMSCPPEWASIQWRAGLPILS